MHIGFWKYIFIFLFLVLALVVIALFQLPDSKFHIIACDVGQGDATLLVYKNIQVLVDGGPGNKVLTCLGRYLPFWDREVELVILTHPDKDHFMGLVDVFKRYKVDSYLYNPISVSKPEYRVLENAVGREGARRLSPRQGLELRLDLIHLDIVAPSGRLITNDGELIAGKEVADSETNKYSIVSLVSFKNFHALLTGDMTPEVSDDLAVNWSLGSIDYIKVPHHGSKNGLTENFLDVLRPAVATISVGRKNIYGFPNAEILKLLDRYGVKTFRTDEVEDVEVLTDGDGVWLLK